MYLFCQISKGGFERSFDQLTDAVKAIWDRSGRIWEQYTFVGNYVVIHYCLGEKEIKWDLLF